MAGLMEKSFPADLKYTREHEWCRIENGVATVGITWHAQDALGDIVYCELPSPGESVSQGDTFGVVESVKAVSDLYAPLSGVITERNEDMIGEPAQLNEDVYNKGWMIRVKLSKESELEGLLSKDAYEKLLQEDA